MIFACDLDNTIIFSYKYFQIGDVPVEVRNSEYISYMTREAYNKLQKIHNDKNIIFVPVTTRSLEQYSRINLGFTPEYSIIENGARIIENGKISNFIETDHPKIPEYYNIIKQNLSAYSVFELRTVEKSFVFGKFINSAACKEAVEKLIDNNIFDFFIVGNKFYIIPKNLNKGEAVLKFCEKINQNQKNSNLFLVAAGDSDMDLPMLNIANTPLKADKGGRFALEILNKVFKISGNMDN